MEPNETPNMNEILKAQFSKLNEVSAPVQAAVTALGGPAETDPVPVAETAAPVVEPVAPSPPDSRMQKVIAQAQQVRAEREALKKDREQNAADMAELNKYRELKARANEDPVAVAEAFGFKPDEYAAVLIDKGAVTPERRKAWEQGKEIQSLTSRLDQYEAQQAQAVKQNQYNQVMAEMKAFAEHAGEDFDLIRRSGDYGRVLTKIDEHYQTTAAMGEPELLPYEQAFEMAEQELFDKVYAPVLDSPKIRGKKASAPPPGTQSAAPVQRNTGNITSKMRSASSPPQEMSEAQSLEAAGRLLFKQFNPGGR